MVEQEDGSVAVERHGVEGKCEDECLTLALACRTHLNDVDIELATLLFERADHTTLERRLCAEMAKGARRREQSV